MSKHIMTSLQIYHSALKGGHLPPKMINHTKGDQLPPEDDQKYSVFGTFPFNFNAILALPKRL